MPDGDEHNEERWCTKWSRRSEGGGHQDPLTRRLLLAAASGGRGPALGPSLDAVSQLCVSLLGLNPTSGAMWEVHHSCTVDHPRGGRGRYGWVKW